MTIKVGINGDIFKNEQIIKFKTLKNNNEISKIINNKNKINDNTRLIIRTIITTKEDDRSSLPYIINAFFVVL